MRDSGKWLVLAEKDTYLTTLTLNGRGARAIGIGHMLSEELDLTWLFALLGVSLMMVCHVRLCNASLRCC